MSNSDCRVDTTSRLVQWKIENVGLFTYRRSDYFEIGRWTWYIVVERSPTLFIKLHTYKSNSSIDLPPIASFIIRLLWDDGCRKILVHPGITDKKFKKRDGFVWEIDAPITEKLIIHVEFLDLKTVSTIDGEVRSIWTEGNTRTQSTVMAVISLNRMLSERIHTDITINTPDGSIGAHRAVLATRSPVFNSMFSHDLKEKEQSTINISDMSIKVCEALLNYMYGNIEQDQFLPHRLELLRVADKYDISDLKESCLDSLIEDIDASNVLERLNNASLYQFPRLKSRCIMYLVKFSKIFDIRDDFNAFLQCADRDLVVEILQEVLAVWKGF